jgi:hypothetical protein
MVLQPHDTGRRPRGRPGLGVTRVGRFWTETIHRQKAFVSMLSLTYFGAVSGQGRHLVSADDTGGNIVRRPARAAGTRVPCQ